MFIITELQFLSVTNCQCYGHPNLETWSEHIPHCLPSPSGERCWVAIQNCLYIVSFTIPMRTQNKIPYQHSHLIMKTLSPSTPTPPKRLFPEGFVICPKRISYLFSDLLHFITQINYSSYHPVTYPYNTKYKRENLIIMTSGCITSRLMGAMLLSITCLTVAPTSTNHVCLIPILLIDGRAISRDVIIAVSNSTHRIHPWHVMVHLPTRSLSVLRTHSSRTHVRET